MKVVFLLILYFSVLSAQPEVPQLKYWATDYTSTLSSGEVSSLNRKLKDYQDTTSTQMVVLMIASLQNYPIEYYTLEVAEKNKIGTKENDNGALLLVVKNDRKLRIEVGHGLEGAIPDALASSIIRNVITPHFRRDDYYQGINAGLDAMISAAAGEYKQDKKDETKPVPGGVSFIFILFLIIMFFLRGGRRRKGMIFLPGGLGGFGGSRGGFGGGGFGGGGFSGGGGSFGGGGASGSW
jgi:uncharacterized protein